MGIELDSGRRIGPYRLLFRLGKGGMGEVWAAAQENSDLGFEKLIALKVLLDKERDSHAAVMFFDEARAAAALDHAAIVQTNDLGQDGKIFYIAMDMVQGPSLTALLQRMVINKARMPPSVVAYIGTQIASALDYAHTRATHQGQQLKLIHRDISPHNVLIELHGGVRLTDFGVARTAIQEHKSTVGTVRGKPSYMAPEQVIGGEIDARTDLFALGTVLYESSCLKRLFGRSNPVKSMDAVLKHQPKLLTELVPDFPEALWRVIERALQKNPDNRFQSAAEMVEALGEATRQIPDAASAPRILSQLVQANFEQGAFDIEGRIAEAAEAAGGVTSLAPTPSAPLPVHAPASTNPQLSQLSQLSEVSVMGAPAHNAWPTVYAPDPLAPEAIEEARTQFRALTPSISNPVMAMYPPSIDGMTPISSSGRSFTGMVAARPRRSHMPAALLALSALLLMGTAALVVASSSRSESPSAHRPAPPRPLAPPTIQPGVTPGARAMPSRPLQPKRPPPPEVEPPAELSSKTPPRTKRKPQPSSAKPKRPKVNTEDSPASTTASFDEVRSLIKQLRSIDPEKGNKLFVTLLEIGRDNPERLAELKTKVLVALKEAK